MSAAGVLAAVALLAAAGCSAPPTTPAAALEHGDCKLSSEDYAAAAMHSGVAIARRASEVSLACENLPAAWQSVQRWRALAPQDADAAASYAAIALKLDKIPQARAAVATVVQAAGANTDARVAALTTTLLEEAEAPVVLAALSPAVERSKPTTPSARRVMRTRRSPTMRTSWPRSGCSRVCTLSRPTRPRRSRPRTKSWRRILPVTPSSLRRF
jgi:hypothetical protein